MREGALPKTRRSPALFAAATALFLAFVLVGGVGATSEAAATTGAAKVGAHAVVRPSPGCTSGSSRGDRPTSNFSTPVDDGSYLEELPTTTSAHRPFPVVFDFHAYEEPGPTQETTSGLGAYGRSHGFATITPWVDDEKVPHWASTVGSRDADWFGQLLTHIEATTCVDENRVFVAGYSNGAFMTSAIACQYSARVAAVAPVSGIQAVTPCPTTRPVPVVAFHGTADPLVPYDGKPSQRSLDLPAPNGSGHRIDLQQTKLFGAKGVFARGPTIPQEATAWAKRNACSSAVTTAKIVTGVDLLSWDCPRHADVELYRIQGGGHTWPGSQVQAKIVGSSLGRTVLALSANAAMWTFFEAHPLTASD